MAETFVIGSTHRAHFSVTNTGNAPGSFDVWTGVGDFQTISQPVTINPGQTVPVDIDVTMQASEPGNWALGAKLRQVVNGQEVLLQDIPQADVVTMVADGQPPSSADPWAVLLGLAAAGVVAAVAAAAK